MGGRPDARRARSVEFASHKFLVPCRDCVRHCGGRHLIEGSAAESVADLAKRRALGIGKRQPLW
jgi:hypothetical protein